MSPDNGLDPVAAYDRIALVFGQIAQRRKQYLDAIDRLVIQHTGGEVVSVLDIGAGDGRRARGIARAAGIEAVTLLEPSLAMSAGSPSLRLRAESLHELSPGYDVILCLWNVLGHIFPAVARTEVLRQCRRLLNPRGHVFIDVNHRYNIAHYGFLRTVPRYLKDLLRPHETNGDVVVCWDMDGTRCTTAGHVFTHREFAAMCAAAPLAVEKRIVVDYATGQERRFGVQGNLLYILRAS